MARLELVQELQAHGFTLAAIEGYLDGIPDDATPGDVLNTGAATNLVLADGRKVANPINTCVTIREPNPAEAVTGSLEGLGLGSLTSGSSALGDIGADPAVFSADLINNIDVGQLIGAVAGS